MDSQVHSDSVTALLAFASVVRKRSLPSTSKPAPKRHCHPDLRKARKTIQPAIKSVLE